MDHPKPKTDAAPPNQTPEYQTFEALVRRVLTTPKAELVKAAPKKVKKKPAKGRTKAKG